MTTPGDRPPEIDAALRAVNDAIDRNPDWLMIVDGILDVGRRAAAAAIDGRTDDAARWVLLAANGINGLALCLTAAPTIAALGTVDDLIDWLLLAFRAKSPELHALLPDPGTATFKGAHPEPGTWLN